MNRSKKIFVAFVIAFVMLLAYVSYDIASRTTFPGSKPQLKERLMDRDSPRDTTNMRDMTNMKDSTDRVEAAKN